MKSLKNHNKQLRKSISQECAAIYAILQDVAADYGHEPVEYMPELQEAGEDFADFEICEMIFADR